jgi:CHAT domain-containing protein
MIAARTEAYLTLTRKTSCFQQHDELPNTEPFVKSLAETLAVTDQDALQLGANASRTMVLRFHEQQRLDDYRYLVFAAHAVAPDDVDPIRQPALILAHPETDDYLTMADVFGLQCNADLIALSACNTGRGEQIRGEGIMGLTRAFMYAGTPAVGVTLWSVDSQASSEVNTRFFRHLKTGKPVADALRQAKLDLLGAAEEDEDLEHFRHPFFWAPFVMFGDGR